MPSFHVIPESNNGFTNYLLKTEDSNTNNNLEFTV